MAIRRPPLSKTASGFLSTTTLLRAQTIRNLANFHNFNGSIGKLLSLKWCSSPQKRSMRGLRLWISRRTLVIRSGAHSPCMFSVKICNFIVWLLNELWLQWNWLASQPYNRSELCAISQAWGTTWVETCESGMNLYWRSTQEIVNQRRHGENLRCTFHSQCAGGFVGGGPLSLRMSLFLHLLVISGVFSWDFVPKVPLGEGSPGSWLGLHMSTILDIECILGDGGCKISAIYSSNPAYAVLTTVGVSIRGASLVCTLQVITLGWIRGSITGGPAHSCCARM